MKRRPLWPLLPPVAVILIAVVMYFTIHRISPPESSCGVRKLTGFHCPGCGGTRSVHDILQGQLLNALSHNAMLVVGLCLFSIGSIYLIVRMTILGKPAPSIPDIKASWLWATLGCVVLFTLLRNIPTWPFSLLAP